MASDMVSQRTHIYDFTRGRIVGKLEEGRSTRDVANEHGVAQSVVARIWKRFSETGSATRRYSSGRPCKTTSVEDRFLAVTEKRCRQLTAVQVAKELHASNGTTISRQTVSKRLNDIGLYARKPVKCIPLTPTHKASRYRWCREHLNWTEDVWSNVLFTDESRFSLSSDSRRQYIWREPNTAYTAENIVEVDHYRSGVMVWAGIMINGLTDLMVLERGTMTAKRYCEEVLIPHVKNFRGAVGHTFVFNDDNTHPHRASCVQDLLETEEIDRMEWPAYSPDLNPIEHPWYCLGRRIAARNPPSCSKMNLICMLKQEWQNIPQELLNILIKSTAHRCQSCIAVKGRHTPY